MADQGPQKAGSYERPARMKGMIIGIVVLMALIILAIVFFSGRRAGAAAFGAGGGHAIQCNPGHPPKAGHVAVDRVL